MNSVLLLKYVKWHFIDATTGLIKAWGTILWFAGNYFSIGLLLRTYFSPWRKIAWDYGRGFDLGRFFFILSSNLISRVLGAVMRSFLIIAGIIAEIFLLFLSIASILIWLTLPALICIAFFYGIFLLF
jgi:hypothetical protein